MFGMATKVALVLVAALFAAAFVIAGEKARVRTAKHEILRGRVMADVASLAFGAGLGSKWASFIFAVETPSRKVIPVRIAYAFYKNEEMPPESFWDYSQLYALSVKRDPKCDTTVQRISFEKNVDEHGNQLPATFILRSAKNAPPQALKPDTVLPCYVLWHGEYERVETTAAR